MSPGALYELAIRGVLHNWSTQPDAKTNDYKRGLCAGLDIAADIVRQADQLVMTEQPEGDE